MSIMKKVMGAALLAGALGLGAGCTEQVNVQIECITAEGPRVECTLKQVKGKSEVEACWDFSATCGNGAVVKAARTCHKIKGGGTEKVTIGADKLTGVDKCGGTTPPTAKLENMTINGKASNL
jgi:hypothetical protein